VYSLADGMRADTRAACNLAMLVLDRAAVTSGPVRGVLEHCLADHLSFPTACELESALASISRKGDDDSAWVPAPGELIAGKYRVSGLLGVGGMGVVVTAAQIDTGHRVAIKLMPPRAARRPAAVERFFREAR